MPEDTTQLAVIGGGPGGYAAAFLAADLGQEVTLIDPQKNPGGVCLYSGCIPSKTLLHLARLINETREAETWGVKFEKPAIDLDKIRDWKAGVVKQLTTGLGKLVRQRKVRHIRTKAAFKDNRTLRLTDTTGTQTTLKFHRAIIATGSKSVTLPEFPEYSQHVWDAAAALDLIQVPSKLLVVGGGYIGLELGSVYAALGAQVTVVEMTPSLLPGVDRDLVRFLKKRLELRFREILLQTKVTEVDILEDGLQVILQEKQNEKTTRTFDKVLVAVGRRPDSMQLGLEHTAVQVDSRGYILTDHQCRTADPGIFAIGDVAGEPMLAHKASHEARIAVEVLAGKNVIFEPAAIPAVVFTDPEIAWAGITEAQVREQGLDYEITRYPWAASGRAATLGRNDGLTKMVIDPDSERLMGVGMVGPGAGEMIAEAVMALEMGANVTDIALSIHPHPTLSETFKEAAEIFQGTATHYYRPKRTQRRNSK